MGNALTFNPKGTRFTLRIDDIAGGLNSDGNAAFLNSNEFQVLSNLLLHLRPPLRKRGSVQRIGTDTFSGVLGYYTGALRSGLTARPYYIAGATHYAQSTGALTGGGVWDVGSWDSAIWDGVIVAAGAAVLVSAGTSFTLAGGSYYTPPAQVGDTMLFANASGVAQFAGTANTAASGAGATFTSSSTAVTGLAGMTSAHVGSFITNTGDSAATGFSYRIAAVGSATAVTLDQAYLGSNNGASKAWRVSSAEDFVPLAINAAATVGVPEFPVTSGTRIAKARCVVSMWNRVVLLNTTEVVNSISTEFPFRVRWSGVHGSTEGTAPFTGIYGFSPTGYVDVNPGLGEIIGAVALTDALLVFQREGITIIHGAPVYNDTGSLDSSTKYPGFRLSVKATTSHGYGPYCAGNEGVFFYDRARGAMLWAGSGPPRPVSTDRTLTQLRTADPDTAGYHRGYCFFTNSVTDRDVMAYYAPSNAWTSFLASNANALSQWDTAIWGSATWGTNSSPVIGCLTAGRPESGYAQYLVGLASSGTALVNFSNAIDNPGDAPTDWTGEPIIAQMQSACFGDPNAWLQPDTIRVTYKSVGGTASVTVATGLPGATNTTSGAISFPANTFAHTKTSTSVGVIADEMVQAIVSSASGVSKFEVLRVTVEGSVTAPKDSV